MGKELPLELPLELWRKIVEYLVPEAKLVCDKRFPHSKSDTYKTDGKLVAWLSRVSKTMLKAVRHMITSVTLKNFDSVALRQMITQLTQIRYFPRLRHWKFKKCVCYFLLHIGENALSIDIQYSVIDLFPVCVQNVTTLEISDPPLKVDKIFPHCCPSMIAVMFKLKHLKIYNCEWLSDDTIRMFPSIIWGRLESLSLFSWFDLDLLTDDGMINTVAESAVNLKYLNLDGCNRLTPLFYVVMCKNSNFKFVMVSLNDNWGLRPTELDSIRNNSKDLQFVSANNTGVEWNI